MSGVKVWIVKGGHDYEGYSILGIYDNEEAAEQHVESLVEDPNAINSWERWDGYDYVEIVSEEVLSERRT